MTRSLTYTLVCVFAASLALAVGNVLYTNHVDGRAEHRNQARARDFCTVVTLIDDRYQKLPPTADPEGKKFADAIHAYRLKLGC